MRESLLSRFLRWWGAELAALLPHGLGRRLKRPALLVELSGRELVLERLRRGGRRPLGRVPLNQADAAERLRRLARGRRSGGALLLIPAAAALRRRITLPLAAEENLREVLSFEMDRFTPFTAEQVVFDYRLLGRRKEEGLIEVELLVAPRAELAAALQVLSAAGLGPRRIEVAGEAADDFDLLPAELAGPAWSLAQRLAAGLAVLAVLLAVASLALEVRQQRQRLAALETALAAARVEAAAVEGLRQRLAELRTGSGRLSELRREAPAVLRVLEEVTNRLPDDSWASEFEIEGDRLLLSGFSTRAAQLIALLEDSPLLTDVRFESSVTMEPRIGLERFLLTARARGEP